jgi:hypothetical protein
MPKERARSSVPAPIMNQLRRIARQNYRQLARTSPKGAQEGWCQCRKDDGVVLSVTAQNILPHAILTDRKVVLVMNFWKMEQFLEITKLQMASGSILAEPGLCQKNIS